MSEDNNTNSVTRNDHPRPIAVECLRILAWPTFGLLVLLSFWQPLHRMIALLPDMVVNSESITLGSVSVRVGKNLSSRASAEIREELAGMSADDIDTILESNLVNESYYTGDIDAPTKQWARLARLGIVTILSPQELADASKKYEEKEQYGYGIRPTAKYDRLRRFLINVVSEVVSSASRSNEESTSKEPK